MFDEIFSLQTLTFYHSCMRNRIKSPKRQKFTLQKLCCFLSACEKSYFLKGKMSFQFQDSVFLYSVHQLYSAINLYHGEKV